VSTNSDILNRNRTNAQNSSGPRTPEGKQKVSQNARKLGLWVADATLEAETPEDLAQILAGYVSEYNPQGPIEDELIRQLTMATHRLRRYERIETVVLDCAGPAPETRCETNRVIAKNIDDYRHPHILRARRAAELAFERAYRHIEARKAARVVDPTPVRDLPIETDLKHAPVDPGTFAILRNKPKSTEIQPTDPSNSTPNSPTRKEPTGR
jgi:hypothetical protein